MPGHSLKKQGTGWVYVHDSDFLEILNKLPAFTRAMQARAHGRPRPFGNVATDPDPDLITMIAHLQGTLDAVQRFEPSASKEYHPRAKDGHTLILVLLRELVKELKKKRNADGEVTPPNLWRSAAKAPEWPPDNGGNPPLYRQPRYDNFVEGYVLEFMTELALKPNVGRPPRVLSDGTQLARVADTVGIMTGMLK